MSEQSKIVRSPCVSVCALDHNDLCIGCGRSSQEIAVWGDLDSDGRLKVLRNIARRELPHPD